MIVRNFDAKIRREKYNQNIAGKETIHDAINDYEMILGNLASATNTYIVVSAKFKHKIQYKVTWMIPGRIEKTQIGSIPVKRKLMKIVYDVRSKKRKQTLTMC